MERRRADKEDRDAVGLYLNGVGRYPLLSKEDEQRLAQTIEAGREAVRLDASSVKHTPARRRELRQLVAQGEQAQLAFVLGNFRLVVSIAKKYQASGQPLLDLIQDGNLGLIHAVEKFDWCKGFKFSTYATWWIRQAITRGVANTGRTIRLPVHAVDTVMRIQQAWSHLEARLGRHPTLEELSTETELPPEKLQEAMRWRSEPISLSEPVGEAGDRTLSDLVADASAASPLDHAANVLLIRDIDRLLRPLDDREAAILRLRYGLGGGSQLTLEEVGKQFNLTRERIRQIEVKAMSKLRHPSNVDGAHDLLME